MQEFVFEFEFTGSFVNVYRNKQNLPDEFAALADSYIIESVTKYLEDGAMTYEDFVKLVQNDLSRRYGEEVTAPKISTIVSYLHGLNKVKKYEDGKGRFKKLYIDLIYE